MSEDIEKDAGFSVEKVGGDPSTNEKAPSPYQVGGPNVSRVNVYTDDDLVSNKPVQWSGFGIKCKECGTPAILHFMKHCGECGAAANVQSKTADEYVKNLQEKYNGT